MKVEGGRLRAFVAAALGRRDVPGEHAAIVAEALVEADLEGQATHGVTRLPFLLRRLDQGLINPRPRIELVEERPATALLDAGNALGPVAGLAAVEIAVGRARSAGCAVVAVRRSNHLGALGFYVTRGAGEGLVTVVLSNTPPAMAPPGGRSALLGTNPIACALPTSGSPVVIDLATSQVARGHILKAAAAGAPIPPGWAIDGEGAETLDPAAALAGSLLPLGGHKGFALALMVEALSGVLAGAAVGPGVSGTFAASDRPSDVGHCVLAIDPDAFGAGFRDRMDALGAAVRAVPPTDPARPPRLPGDRRRGERAEREREGVEVGPELARELAELAGRAL